MCTCCPLTHIYLYSALGVFADAHTSPVRFQSLHHRETLVSSWSAFDFSVEKGRSLCSVGLLSGTLLSLLLRRPAPGSVPPPRLGAPHWLTSPLTSADPRHPREGHPNRCSPCLLPRPLTPPASPQAFVLSLGASTPCVLMPFLPWVALVPRQGRSPPWRPPSLPVGTC